MFWIFSSIAVAMFVYLVWIKPKGKSERVIGSDQPFPEKWKSILDEKVNFYSALQPDQQSHFEDRVKEFLNNHRITGIQTDVADEDRLLIASSAIIPIFAFPEWHYTNLYEVLLYPESFSPTFDLEGPGRNILGMVGTGYMDGKMILSKRALHHGFENDTDKRNTALHEFVHLIDKMDGSIDGIPEVLMENPNTLPWIELMKEKMEEIHEGESNIDIYGGTAPEEFLTVASEYFFERPKLLKTKHPLLYGHLTEIYNLDMVSKDLRPPEVKISRNDPCPCGSGEKFKRCCMD